MELQLSGHTALVTGASGAIGGAIAHTLAAEGASVLVGWHTASDRAADVVRRIQESGGAAHAVRVDQSQPDALPAGVSTDGPVFGAVDIVVAAAVTWPSADAEGWRGLAQSHATNVVGTLSLVECMLPAMRERGWGRIVAISTHLVDQPLPMGVAYPAAKGAVEAAARVWAVREAGHGILCNVVRPGFTLTEKALNTPGLGQAAIDAESARTPTGQVCTPEDVAATVAFLASGANRHVNGQVLSVAGGRELSR